MPLPSLSAVDAYPVPELLVPRIMENHHRDREFAEAIVREIKRMLLLWQIIGSPCSPSVEIDDAWHEMILFTRYYFQFCNFLGTDYIHHGPGADLPAGKTPGKSLYEETLEHYERVFGIQPDPRYWTP